MAKKTYQCSYCGEHITDREQVLPPRGVKILPGERRMWRCRDCHADMLRSNPYPRGGIRGGY